MAVERKLDLIWVEAGHLENDFESDSGGEEEYKAAWEKMKSADGVVVPGGFGTRGFNGKVAAAKFCRESSVPYLGICLGQLEEQEVFLKKEVHNKGFQVFLII